MVFQKNALFKGSIRDNMRLGNQNATDDEIIRALQISQSLEFVQRKEGFLDFMVEQDGKNLSGGQKQRLCIARALVAQPDILILDDSASALDFATDAALRKSLSTMNPSPTLFIVSQRAASLMHADLIIVLDDGQLAGIGTHEQLLSNCEVYQEIYYSQYPKEVAM
jgi:ABC-type multidrug transport system fused ATPase/permease subunit